MAVTLIICTGVGGYKFNEFDNEISSFNSPESVAAQTATVVPEGDSVTVGGVTVQQGWSIVEGEILDVSMRNASDTSGEIAVNFYFMDGSDVIDDVTCTTGYIDADETDDAPTCDSAFPDIDEHDEVRVDEGDAGPPSSTSAAPSSESSPWEEEAAVATVVSEGESATVDGVHVEGGWSVVAGKVAGLSVRNDTGMRDFLDVTFYFMEGGDVIDTYSCMTRLLDPGETDGSPGCIDAYEGIDPDEIRVAEGP